MFLIFLKPRFLLHPVYWLLAVAVILGCRPVRDDSRSADAREGLTPSAEQAEAELSPTLSPAPEVRVVYPNVPGSFVATARKVKPAVVNIFTAQIVRQSPFNGWFSFDDFFGHSHRDRIQRSLGSGFIIDPQGFILTNFHVVRGAHEILVELEDEREVPAVPVGADPDIDVALLHVEDTELNPAQLGNSDALEVGEWVVAIGNPFGLSHTVTAGIVSAKGRDFSDLGMNQRGHQNFIQTDASINPGNSGGPLANVAGEVVGMNTAIAASGQGLGFAVPINMIKAILPQLKRNGRVVPTWLGVGVREMTKELAGRFNAPTGLLITDVYPGGPAEQGGLRLGDVIVSFNGQKVSKSEELSWLTSIAGVGNEVKVQIFREGKYLAFSLRVVQKPKLTR